MNRPAASFYTPQQLSAISQSWAARGRHEADSAARLDSRAFDWGDFGLGAGAMLGGILLAGGLGAGLHYGRRSSVRVRPVS